MKLSGIISITGKSGLSKVISQTRTGLIVESLVDGKRSPVHSADRMSSLEDISIYTHEDDVLLTEVFSKIIETSNDKKILSHKSSAEELKAFMKTILPNYDEDRVYVSDLKKLVQWYNLLHEKGLLAEEDDKPESKESDKKAKGASQKAAKSTTKAKQPKLQVKKPNTKSSSNQKNTQGATKGR